MSTKPTSDVQSLGINPFLKAISSMGLLLALFAFITLLLCIVTYQLTLPKIEDNHRQALAQALLEVMPQDQFDNNLLAHSINISSPLLNYDYPVTAYMAKKNGTSTGIVFPVAAPQGYGGTIHLLVGINREGILTGVRVLLPHPETPGLGDKIDVKKSDWIKTFTGKSLKNPPKKDWAVKKDGGSFDSFTGATITPRAVVKGVYGALEYFDQHHKQLFEKLKAPNDNSHSLQNGFN